MINVKDTGTSFPFAQPQHQPDGDNSNFAHASPSPLSIASPPTAQPDHRPPSAETEAVALRELKRELANVSHDEKSSLVHAQRVAPELIDDRHLLRFVRAEDYDVNVRCLPSSFFVGAVFSWLFNLHYVLINLFSTSHQLALKRLLRYWEHRHRVFGDDYCLPLTLNGMCFILLLLLSSLVT